LTLQPLRCQTTADQTALATRPTSIGIPGRLRSESGGRHQSESPADFIGIRTLDDIERQIKALQAEAEELRIEEGIEQLRLVITKLQSRASPFQDCIGRRQEAVA
jgi:hypothetical protein